MKTPEDLAKWSVWYNKLIHYPRPAAITQHDHIVNMYNYPLVRIPEEGSYHFYVESAKQLKRVLQRFEDVSVFEQYGIVRVAGYHPDSEDMFFEGGDNYNSEFYDDSEVAVKANVKCLVPHHSRYHEEGTGKLDYYFDHSKYDVIKKKSLIIDPDLKFPCVISYWHETDWDRVGKSSVSSITTVALKTKSLIPGRIYLG